MRQFGELEAVIMDRLWEWGRPVLVREMVDDLSRDRPLAYTTVMTVMENLHRKGWLRRERDGRAWSYEPTSSRSAYTAALMNDALGTSADRRTALAHFVLQMSPHDVKLLQQALDQAHGQTPSLPDRGQPPQSSDQGQPPRPDDQGQVPRSSEQGQPPRPDDQGQVPRSSEQGQPPRPDDQGQVPQPPDRGGSR
jgi:predicted transcriptional regulator